MGTANNKKPIDIAQDLGNAAKNVMLSQSGTEKLRGRSKVDDVAVVIYH